MLSPWWTLRIAWTFVSSRVDITTKHDTSAKTWPTSSTSSFGHSFSCSS